MNAPATRNGRHLRPTRMWFHHPARDADTIQTVRVPGSCQEVGPPSAAGEYGATLLDERGHTLAAVLRRECEMEQPALEDEPARQ